MGEHEADDAAAAEEGLLGATDIVEAFTALRHELKLQVRAGRELTGGLGQVLAAAVESPLAVVAQRLGDLQRHAGHQPPVEGQDQRRAPGRDRMAPRRHF